MNKTLFQYAVLFHEKIYNSNQNVPVETKSQLIVEPSHILADNEATARILIARAIPEKYTEKLQDIQILIRPF